MQFEIPNTLADLQLFKFNHCFFKLLEKVKFKNQIILQKLLKLLNVI